MCTLPSSGYFIFLLTRICHDCATVLMRVPELGGPVECGVSSPFIPGGEIEWIPCPRGLRSKKGEKPKGNQNCPCCQISEVIEKLPIPCLGR